MTMTRPYLYAKSLFRDRSKKREDLQADHKFFQAVLAGFENTAVRAFLTNPLYDSTKKLEVMQRSLMQNGSMLVSHESLLRGWIRNKSFKDIEKIYYYWIQLVEDFFQEGEILLSSEKPLADTTLAAIKKFFNQHEPSRQFSFRYVSLDDHDRATAQFRDSVLDLRAPVLLKKLILSLKEGF